MSPQSRRDAVATSRSSFPSLADIVARVAPVSRSRARARRWAGRALLLGPAVAIVASDAVRRGEWMAQMSGSDLRSYGTSLVVSVAL